MKNLREALDMAKRCEDICADFEKHQPPGTIDEWKRMKSRWEMDPSQPDPYQTPERGEPIVHTNSPILTLGFHSVEPQFRETKARRD